MSKKVIDVVPVGSQVLIENIGTKEILNSSKIIVDNEIAIEGAPQAYVLAIGPKINKDDWNFKVGDRVIVQVKYIAIYKNYWKSDREMGLIEPSMIKAILVEED